MTYPASELILNADGSIYHLRLLPEDVADTVLVVGDPDRVSMISQFFDRIEVKKQHREFVTHTGSIGKKRFTVVSSGIGADNVEIVMTELDAVRNIDLKRREPLSGLNPLKIIRIGTSGSLQQDIPLGSVVASSAGVGLDGLLDFYATDESLWAPEFCAELRQTLQLRLQPYAVEASATLLNGITSRLIPNLYTGITLTCPGFYAPQGRSLRLSPQVPDSIALLQQFSWNGNRITNFEMETAAYYLFGKLLDHEMLSLSAIVANRVSNEFASEPEKIVQKLIRDTLDWLVA
ncbi:phosphorylase [Siphonobacter sp. BAB-5385]|uniref:nucleoside phosphorylase n=1 Tax=Siphonobacter sp. BAB-5385 TaxID=1864822 RepID=UPI000B9EAD11|nr:nucleoside phosphorylase [Siphonobacter sp. BAB-5385]OZI07731.1 phosphorylase [Siphonobacter sp. BAB-5385]